MNPCTCTRILLHLGCLIRHPLNLWFHVSGILREFHS